MSFIPVQIQKKKLSAPITSSATSISLQSLRLLDDTTNVTMANFGTIGYATLEPGTSREENITFTGITQNADGTATLTTVTRGLAFVSPFASAAANKFAHAGGTNIVFGMNASMVQALKDYIDAASIAGAVPATDLVAGIGVIATQTQIDAGTATEVVGGVTYPLLTTPDQLATSIYTTRLPTADQKAALAATTTPASGNKYVSQKDFQLGAEIYAADSVGTDAYAITLSPAPAAYAAGMTFRFKAGTANTGAATLKINSLAAIDIKKNFNVALETGDILAGQIVTVTYDATATAFQMQSPVAAPTLRYKAGVVTKADISADGAQTIAHGLGRTPVFVRFSVKGINTVSNSQVTTNCDGFYDASGTGCVFTAITADVTSGSGHASGGVNKRTDSCIYIPNNTNNAYATAAVDATNITLTWAKAGSPVGSAEIFWEVYA